MSNSVSSQVLIDALSRCVRERFSHASLDKLCDGLEIGSKSSDDPTFELLEAMTNYAYQLRDGAIQITADTTSLFKEAQSLLDEDTSSRRGISFDDEVANLLERLDLEASGGFDALEAGEVPEFDKSTDSESDSLRIHNTIHRLLAGLESIEYIAEEIPSSAPFTRIFSQHRKLLDSLILPARKRHTLPLTTLQELLTLQLTFTGTDLDVDEEGVVHPTYIPILSSLLTQLADVLSIGKIRDTQISLKHDAIEIQMTLLAGNIQVSGLRARAIERGFLHPDAPLHEGAEFQYSLLPESVKANELLIESSMLFSQLQSLCAEVVIESTNESHLVTTTLSANVQLEEVTVFKLNGANYALLTESIAEVVYFTSNDRSQVRPSFKNEHEPYRISSLNKSDRDHEACLLTYGSESQIALFVDQIEPSGQLPILEPLSAITYVGGSVSLLDRRLVILLSPEDLDESVDSTFNPRISLTFRLLVLGSFSLASQLSRHAYEPSIADGELDATAKFQEQRPHLILVEQRNLPTYRNLLTRVSELSIPVIVHISGLLDVEVEGWHDGFKLISSVTELETLIQTLAVVDD